MSEARSNDEQQVAVLRSDQLAPAGQPVNSADDARRCPLPENCIFLTAQVLDPPEPIIHPPGE